MSNAASAAYPIVAPKKLIEVAIPLDEINQAAAHEKSIRHGHPSTLHLWWSRKPLALTRAVLFGQCVNDPSWKYSDEELSKPQVKAAITRKRNELFRLLMDLVQWENTNNEAVLKRARTAILESWRETCEANKNHPDAKALFNPNEMPPFHDPFAGGGSLPLEAARLGMDAYASDLNPVAVLINKAMIEIPPRFAGRHPVGPLPEGEKQTKSTPTEDWSGARGLAEDVRRYGAWIRNQAYKAVGHLHPKIKITTELVRSRPELKGYEGQELTVIAWLWARTVASPNPAVARCHVPLVSNFWLSTKKDRPTWVEPVVDRTKTSYRFSIKTGGKGASGPVVQSTVERTGAVCLLSGTVIPFKYIRDEAKAGRLGSRLMAVALEGSGRRIYVEPTEELEALAMRGSPNRAPTTELPDRALGFRVQEYGITKHADLFTKRQLAVLTTLSDLVMQAHADVIEKAKAQGIVDDGRSLEEGGTGATAYADAVAIYLAMAVSRYANSSSTLCAWNPGESKEDIRFTFARQALSMSWEFAESNPFSESSGNFLDGVGLWVYKSLRELGRGKAGHALQADAATAAMPLGAVISTDPPYYDNIGYADLADFFYVWLRRTLSGVLPGLFATLLSPKSDELIASPFRHSGRERAEQFFLEGMSRAMSNMAARAHPSFPLSIYYAFKQSETNDIGTASTGWETFLAATLASGLALTGTWPTRSERRGRMRDVGSNALASSIVLVCRPRAADSPSVSRRDFLRELERIMPKALGEMTADPIAAIAPVDLDQAAIGPGMAIFSKYKTVLEADGSPMSVHNALIHINKAIDDYFAQSEGEMDADTRFCIGWFQQHEFEEGPFGEADVLARAKGTAVDGVRDAGVIQAGKGKVRLLRVKEYPASWDPTKDSRLPIWEACHQMCRALGESESEAGALLARMPEKQDSIRQLAYRLYTICERKGWAEDARAYNELVTSWPAIVEQSLKTGHKGSQMNLL